VAEGARLESVYTARYPGFESLSLRHILPLTVLRGRNWVDRRRIFIPMLTLRINGQSRPLDLELPVSLEDVLNHLGIQTDRVAVEYNKLIVARSLWPETLVHPDDRMEIVHFVGGGLG
jgi:sulfur carrier protein